MKICSDNHEEICYEGRGCPACILKQKIEEEADRAYDAEKEIERMKVEIEHLQECLNRQGTS
jgi:hypothetical protein